MRISDFVLYCYSIPIKLWITVLFTVYYSLFSKVLGQPSEIHTYIFRSRIRRWFSDIHLKLGCFFFLFMNSVKVQWQRKYKKNISGMLIDRISIRMHSNETFVLRIAENIVFLTLEGDTVLSLAKWFKLWEMLLGLLGTLVTEYELVEDWAQWFI